MMSRIGEGRTAVTIAIAAFLIRGTFYCVAQPLWEGFDEWAHFAYVEHIVRQGHLPSTTDMASDELRRAVELSPLSASAAEYARTSLTHDAFWRLTPEARRNRDQHSPTLRIYEAQQPPLYYLILVGPYWAASSLSYPAQVLTLRLVSLLIAGLGLYLCYRLAVQVAACHRAAVPLLFLLAVWPGLLASVARIANDTLALVLSAAFILSLFRVIRPDSRVRDWILPGVILGGALLTKSYLLSLVPVLPIAAMLVHRRRPALLGCALAIGLAGVMAGDWYVHTWQATGTISGEQIDIAAAQSGIAGKIATIGRVPWLHVLDTAATSQIWTGGWSFLTARSWMYHTFELLGLASWLGFVLLAFRSYRQHRGARLFIAACSFVLFCLGLAYFAVIVYQTRGMATVLGWHLYGILGAEMVVLGAGFTGLCGVRRGAACVAGMTLLAAALDVFVMNFIALPYYAGVIVHTASGMLPAFHLSSLHNIGLTEIFDRLAINKPAHVGGSLIATLWAAYVCATTALALLSAITCYRLLRSTRN